MALGCTRPRVFFLTINGVCLHLKKKKNLYSTLGLYGFFWLLCSFAYAFHSFVTNPLWCGLVFLSLHSWRKSDLCWLPGQQTMIVFTSTCAYWMAHLSCRQKTCVLRWCGRLASQWRECLTDILNNVNSDQRSDSCLMPDRDLFSINRLIKG